MLLFSDPFVKVSPETACEPCTFKALWFSDSAFLAPSRDEGDFLLVMLELLYAAAGLMKEYLYSIFITKLYLLLTLPIHLASISNTTTLCTWTSSKIECTLLQEAPISRGAKFSKVSSVRPCTINRLPVELRLKILENLVHEDTIVKAVGYSDGARNLFLVKERGYCPLSVMLTCKQFHLDMQDVYFRSISVIFKAACPSAFDGDMSLFTSDYFRNNVRTVKISDPDVRRRHKIASAFHRAQIVYQDKGASGARRGAYYFG